MKKSTKLLLFATIEGNEQLLLQLSQAVSLEQQLAFTDAVAAAVPLTFKDSDDRTSFFASFCGWSGFGQSPPAPDAVVSALFTRERIVDANRKDKRDWAEDIGLKPSKHDAKPAPKRVFLASLKKVYPPLGEYVAETQRAKDLWSPHFAYGHQPDSRLPRRPVHSLQTDKLQYVVPQDESCLIYDKKTRKIVAVVLRDFCNDAGVVDWAERVVAQGVSFKKSIRLEDPGSLVLMGYSAGARSRPCFDWARNIRFKQDTDVLSRFNYESSSVFALFWNLCRSRLPSEIISDIDTFLSSGITRMDAGGMMDTGAAAGTGHYTVNPSPDVSFTFHDAQLAPPSGVFACNYSRAIHYEHQPHEYSISWTLTRSEAPSAGGNFFMSRYGVRIEQARNTVVAWMPKQSHGTSLQHLSPDDPNPQFIQTGLAFVTSPRILRVWRDLQQEIISREEALKQLADIDEVCYE